MTKKAKFAQCLKMFAGLCALMLGGMLGVFNAGCNTDSGNNTTQPESAITITPTSVTLSATQVSTFEFVASGGTSNYTWSVSTPNFGTIKAAPNGISATYQSTATAGVNVIEVTDSSTGAATATVTQQ
jgi:hypothetical protein